jgi:metal-responsive CopG/Arc/MetJ family transcriptional regulator
MKVQRKKHGEPETGFKRRRMSTAATKKVIVEFPQDLLDRAEQRASDLSTNRSKLIRSAVEQYLEFSARLELERALAEGYRANDVRNREISQELRYVDSENI